MAGTTAAPWSIPYPEPADEPKVWPALQQTQSERVALMLKEHVPIIKAYTGSATLKSGELAEQKKSGETFTLPAVGTANQIIGVFCSVAACKITTSGGALIYGDFVSAAATITLGEWQHVTLQSNGAAWLIVAGEPKREQKYTSKTYTHAEALAGIPISATRLAFVTLGCTTGFVGIKVGGETVEGNFGVGTGIKAAQLMVPPGQLLVVEVESTGNLFTSTLLQ